MKHVFTLAAIAFVALSPSAVFAATPTNQEAAVAEAAFATTSTSTATTTVVQIPISTSTAPQRAPVLPEEKQVTPDVFNERPVDEVNVFNVLAYFIQQTARVGVPTETIALVLLFPFLVTIVAFVRNVVGLKTLDVLVPVIFAIAILASGFGIGLILLATIVLSSMFARIALKRVRIMQLSKIALTMMVVSFSVLLVLTILALNGFFQAEDVSIVPILLFILMSERISRLQFEVVFARSFSIIITTLAIGTLGYLVLSLQDVREMVLLYPELILLLIPVNVIIGRYFGLRFTEYVRFRSLDEEE